MEEKIKQLLIDNSEQLFGAEVSPDLIQLQETKKEFEGDLTLVLFPFVKLLKTSPQAVGDKVAAFLKENMSELTATNQVGGYLNLSLSDDNYLSDFQQIYSTNNYGFQAADSKKTIMVEFASPNTNKPLHLGHLRNIFLGDSVSEILKAAGHKVIKTQIINDRGIHICKSMLAWEKFSPLNEKGERETPQNTGMKGDKLVGKYYVEFDKNLKIETNEILADWTNENFEDYPENTITEVRKIQNAKIDKDEKQLKEIDSKLTELAKKETQLLKDAGEMLVKWEARDPQTYLLWTTMNSWVYKGFEDSFKKMKVAIDKNYYESDTFLLGKDIVLQGLKDGVFYQKEDNSVWIDLTSDGLDEKLVLRSDGTSVYMTQDIGTAVDRYKDFPEISGMVYTVGNEQDYHFKVLFLILQKMGYAWAENCFHLSYGMVDLPTGKMKSREGTVVDADDLIDEVIQKAKENTKERGQLDGMSKNEIDALCEIIALGGLKYYLLKVDPKKRMLFNPQESIELNGNTGPFIQYCYARIKSVLNKAGNIGGFEETEINASEKEIIKQISNFPQIIIEAAKNYSPALVVNYLFELVKLYNSYYQTYYILSEEVDSIKNFRLALSKTVADILEKGMHLLGAEVPEKM